MSCFLRTASTSGVHLGSGPSSKVSTIVPRGTWAEVTLPFVVLTIGPPSLTNLGTLLVSPSGRSPAASLPPGEFATPATSRTSRNTLASTTVSTRDDVIRRGRTGYCPSAAGAGVFGALVFGGLVGFADAEGATEADAGAVGAAVTGGGRGWRVTGAGAAGRTTRAGAGGGLGFADGRSGVTCCTEVSLASGAALAAGRADGDANTLTSTIAR